eukprot:432593_1
MEGHVQRTGQQQPFYQPPGQTNQPAYNPRYGYPPSAPSVPTAPPTHQQHHQQHQYQQHCDQNHQRPGTKTTTVVTTTKYAPNPRPPPAHTAQPVVVQPVMIQPVMQPVQMVGLPCFDCSWDHDHYCSKCQNLIIKERGC